MADENTQPPAQTTLLTGQPGPIPPEPPSYAERLAAYLNNTNTVDEICSHISNGGALTELCRSKDLRYSDLVKWFMYEPTAKTSGRFDAFQAAMKARDEWEIETILGELRALGLRDVRKLFDSNGAVLPPGQWPEDVAKAVDGFESEEMFDKLGNLVGMKRKVKLSDKRGAIELQMKRLRLLLNIHAVAPDAKTLEELVGSSFEHQAAPPAAPESQTEPTEPASSAAATI